MARCVNGPQADAEGAIPTTTKRIRITAFDRSSFRHDRPRAVTVVSPKTEKDAQFLSYTTAGSPHGRPLARAGFQLYPILREKDTAVQAGKNSLS
jgi:hypothetical protein